MKKIFAVFILFLCSQNIFAQSTWSIDNSNSKITFSVSHMTINDVEGYFKTFNGQVAAADDEFTDAYIEFEIGTASVVTGNDTRDKHLASDDFFNSLQYPKIIFKSTSFKKVNDKKYRLTGDLTIRDVTKPVTFDVTYNGTVISPYKKTVAGFRAVASINRFDYNLKWNAKLDNGNLVAGETVNIVANIEMVKK
jgi:polyisoprenoid-binding protein YceI